MLRFALGLSMVLVAGEFASAAVIVLGNYTPLDIDCTVSDGGKKRTVTIAKSQVRPVTVGGPCDVTFLSKPDATTLRLDPYHAYVFLPDPKAGVKLDGVFLPGDIPLRDTKPDPNPAAGAPLKVPVTLMVDDADPRADALWQRILRKRFDEAAEVIRAHAPIQLEFAGYATWESDPASKDMSELLGDFATKVKVKPGSLAIGYTSRVKVDPKEPQHLIPFGAAKSVTNGHILLRESGPKSDPEKVEAMIQHLGLAFGATLIENDKDPGSVMRVKIADGLALHPQYRYRFDPLNALALNIWAEELRKGPLGKPGDASEAGRQRLARIYKALLKERPGDSFALEYLNELDREVAKLPEPKPKDPAGPAPMPKADPPPAPMILSRDQVARHVVRAIVAKAKTKTDSLSGDELTKEYVKAAAAVAWREDGPQADQEDRMSGLLIGLGIALDDTDALRNDPESSETVKGIESDADRTERVKLLGNPTLNGRRDWCRRFAIGCASGELHRTASAAEKAAVARSLDSTVLSFSALAAEFAGIELSRKSNLDLIHVRRLAGESSLASHLPNFAGLREGISVERFREDYGSDTDPRFRSAVDAIRDLARKK
ncbi:MAG: hypothetical protein U0791_09220 [Gemmataceae bacterium]